MTKFAKTFEFLYLLCYFYICFISCSASYHFEKGQWLKRFGAKMEKKVDRIDKRVEKIFDILTKDQYAKHLQEVAIGKNAIQSSTYLNYNEFKPDKAVDGNTKSHAITGIENRPYWIVDLGKTYQIQRVEVYNRRDCCGGRLHDLTVTVGTTYNTMKPCAFYKGPAVTGAHILLNCKELKRGSNVKLMIKDREYLQLAEVEVFAYDY